MFFNLLVSARYGRKTASVPCVLHARSSGEAAAVHLVPSYTLHRHRPGHVLLLNASFMSKEGDHSSAQIKETNLVGLHFRGQSLDLGMFELPL